MGIISAELVESTEKRDSRGRRLAGEARRKAILAAYDGSGLTQRVFADREGVSYHTLVTWLVRRRREQPEATAPVRFAEVRLPRPGPGLEVQLPSGIVIRGSDGTQVAALIRALER
jgi:DNA-binding transcriptional regulator YiaG